MSENTLSREHLLILKFSTNGVLILDDDGQIIQLNQNAAQIFGFTYNEMLGRTSLPGRKIDLDLDEFVDVDNYDLDHSLITKSGKIVYVNIKALTLDNYVVLIVRDVTERKKLERDYLTSRKLLEKRTKEMKCLTKISEYTWDDTTELDHLLFLIVNTIPMGYTYPLDLGVLITLRGEEFGTDDIIIYDEFISSDIQVNGQVIGNIKLYYRSAKEEKDIGPFYIEEEVLLENIADRIGKLVERRENWTRLKQQEEKLIETEKLKVVSQMVGGIAHDFNNLLTTIMGFTELSFEMINNPDRLSKYLKLIMNAAETGSNLTSQLLSFGKQSKISETEFTFNELMEDMYPILKTMLPDHIKLEYNINSTEEIRADIHIIERIILNLVLNSKEAFIDGGHIFVSCKDEFVSKHSYLLPGKYIRLSIKDTGIGMTEEVQSKIFNPFFTTKEHGTGLGLASVKSTVDELQGYIEVESEINKGTEVTIFLPVAINNDDIEGREKNLSYEDDEKPQKLVNMTFLIVEDELQVATVLETALEDDNTIHLFTSPEKALEWAYSHLSEVDLIISDIIMPKINGISLINKLADKFEHLPPVLFISAYTGDNLDKTVKIPTHFLRKPFTISKLNAKIREILTD